MPLIETSSYRPPRGLKNGHLQTIYPALFRRLPVVTTRRERLTTPDGDFLDLDWSPATGTNRLAILSHGLEGDSHNTYVQGMAVALIRDGWDILAWNFRGCSGEPNRLLRSYHSGASDDLHAVVNHVPPGYRHIALVGFSLGGNLNLKYLGEPGVDPRVRNGVAFSVPCDLAGSSLKLESFFNRIYMRRFLRSLAGKVRQKKETFPGRIHDTKLDAMRTFREFDGTYTAPLNGFASADDYWQKSSCQNFLPSIQVPTLLVNAADDPFLPPSCFPAETARQNPFFHLEIPTSGGHIGFVSFNSTNEYWSESRATKFLRNPQSS